MTLISCPECENQISDKADSCPSCGYPLGKKIIKISDLSSKRYKKSKKYKNSSHSQGYVENRNCKNGFQRRFLYLKRFFRKHKRSFVYLGVIICIPCIAMILTMVILSNKSNSDRNNVGNSNNTNKLSNTNSKYTNSLDTSDTSKTVDIGSDTYDIEYYYEEVSVDDIKNSSKTNITWDVSDDLKTLYINGVGTVSPKTCDYKWSAYADYIEKIVIGEGITSIEGGINGIGLPVSIIGASNNKLKEVLLPSTLRIIDNECFTWTNIKKINIPDNVIYIGNMSFFCCYALEEIEISKNLQKIGDQAFYGCHSLKSLVLPEGLTETNNSFGDLHELDIVYIPSTIQTWVDTDMFGFKRETQIYYNGSLKDWIGLGNVDSPNNHYNTSYEQFMKIYK